MFTRINSYYGDLNKMKVWSCSPIHIEVLTKPWYK